MPNEDLPADDERFDAIFDHTADLPERERWAYLTEACGGDEALRQQLEDLLKSESHRHGQEFMDDPTVENADDVAQSDALVGTTIGSYKVLQVLGEGGYGVVYLAEQREPVKRRVALKVIKLGMDTRQVIARFEAERQALAMMEHPNIAKVFEAGATESGRPYFVMELVRGVPITEYCDQCNLPLEKRLRLFIDVCHAVQHAHQKGVIHRDLKPNNILVTLHDGIPVGKVIDFGIAKATNIHLTDKTLFTDFRQFVGTPAYTSPEQAEMSGLDVDTRSDIYSLGVLLYELLTGTTPVPMETLKQAAYAEIQRTIREADPPTPSNRLSTLANARQLEVASARSESPNKLRQFLRGELDWILMKALEKDRERRYDTANAFAKDIQHFLANEPITAGAPGVFYRLRKQARRHKAAAAIALALLLGGFVSTWQAIRASKGELQARKNLYIADMNVVQASLEAGNMERAITILESHIPKRGERDLRHWEWRYLWGQAHRELFTLIADDDPDDAEKADAIFDLSLSPDGKIMASAAMDGRIRVWDLERLSERFQFQIPAGEFAWTDISPNSQFLAASGQDWHDETALETDQPLPSGQGSDEPRSSISIWDIASEKEIHRFSIAPSRFACSPRFITDGLICVGGSEGNLWFCDLDSGDVHPVNQHDAPLEGVAAAGNHIVTVAADRVRLWDAAERRAVSSLDFDKLRRNTRAEISPDGQRVAVFNVFEPAVAIHDASNWKVVDVIHVNFDVYAVRFNHDGSSLAISEGNGAIRLLETQSWQEKTRYHIRSHQLNVSVFSSEGSIIISGGENGVITAWPGNPSAQGVLQSSGNVISSVQYSPDGRLIATGAGDGRVELWAAERETKLLEIPAQTEQQQVFRIDFYDFSPDSQSLAIGHQEQEAYSVDLWDLVSLERVDRLAHPARVGAVAYSPDGKLLATGCWDREGIRIWDIQRRKVIKRMDEGKSIECLTFSPDSRVLASKGWDNEGVIIWDVSAGKRLEVLDEHVEPYGNTSSLLFSPDGQWLATAGYDRQVILWDTDKWTPEKRLLGHAWLVIDLAFSPDGKRLASSSPESWCRVWDVDSGRELVRFPGLALDFSPEGNVLAVAGEYVLPGSLTLDSPNESTLRIHRAPALTYGSR